MWNLIKKNKQTNKTKQKQIDRKGDQIGGFQRGRGLGMGERVKGDVVNNMVTGLHSDR